MTVVVNVHEAKSQLSKLLERVAAGERVIIAKAGTPVADLVLHRPAAVTLGTARADLVYDDAAFEADDEVLAMFYGADLDGAE